MTNLGTTDVFTNSKKKVVGMEGLPFNMNNSIKVKLTQFGIDLLRKQEDELRSERGENPVRNVSDYRIQVDQDGYTKFQMWDFMKKVGPYLGLGMPDMVNANILILEDNITNTP